MIERVEVLNYLNMDRSEFIVPLDPKPSKKQIREMKKFYRGSFRFTLTDDHIKATRIPLRHRPYHGWVMLLIFLTLLFTLGSFLL